MKLATIVRDIFLGILIAVIAFALLLLIPAYRPRPAHRNGIKMEMMQLVAALESFRITVGNGSYPPSSADDLEAVKQFLAKAFPDYRGDLPEKYKNLDAASSMVFWLGGMAEKDGKLVGFSDDPKNPFDITNKSRIFPSFDFDPKRLRNEGGLPVFLPFGADSQSDPYVYFRPDSKGKYHGAWRNCLPCRDSTGGGWVNPKTYQLFSPGLDAKYGRGVQYPSGSDYDAQRRDDMSNFTKGTTLDDDSL